MVARTVIWMGRTGAVMNAEGHPFDASVRQPVSSRGSTRLKFHCDNRGDPVRGCRVVLITATAIAVLIGHVPDKARIA